VKARPFVLISTSIRDVVLGHGPWLSLSTKLQSLVLSLALKPKSLLTSLNSILDGFSIKMSSCFQIGYI